MAKVRLTKEFGFEMAHLLDNYDGPCRNIHGHSYKLMVTVAGQVLNDSQSPKCGMVVDFGELKKIVNEEVVDVLDHALMVRQGTAEAATLATMHSKIICVPYRPTCENMVVDFATRLRARMPEGLELVSIRLHETATSYAEWHAADN